MVFFSKKRLYILSIIGILGLICFFSISYAAQGNVTLKINGIWIRHGTPNNVNLWIHTTSVSDQEIVGQFDNYFWVEDLEWYITWHYTTIQCDGVYGPGWTRLTWVYLKAENINPTLIQWNPWNVHIFNGFSDYYNIISPTTYIYKPTAPGNIGIVNRYGDKPFLKVIVPGYSPPGNYSGTIVFSFYSY